MSTTHSKRVANTARAVDYELYGAKGSAKYKQNKADGTDRVAAMRCDLESPEEFVARAEALARKHGRKIEARSLIQSFSRDEFDPDNRDDVRLVNDMGYEYAKLLFPNSDALVITHTDGHGGHPHNHIKVINHDNVTGRALQANNMYWHTQKVNDGLMRERGLDVVMRDLNADQRSYWESQREGPEVSTFDQQLGDDIEAALSDPRSMDLDSYRSLLDEKGIELIEKQHTIKASTNSKTPEQTTIGWTYKAVDDTRDTPRSRRRKASSLSQEFTREGAHQIFAERKLRSRNHGIKRSVESAHHQGTVESGVRSAEGHEAVAGGGLHEEVQVDTGDTRVDPPSDRINDFHVRLIDPVIGPDDHLDEPRRGRPVRAAGDGAEPRGGVEPERGSDRGAPEVDDRDQERAQRHQQLDHARLRAEDDERARTDSEAARKPRKVSRARQELIDSRNEDKQRSADSPEQGREFGD